MLRSSPFATSILICFGFMVCLPANAQPVICGTDSAHFLRLQQDAVYRSKIQALNSGVMRTLNADPQQLPTATLYSIPVVVHVIHLGEPIGTGTNISDSQILGAIKGLNNRWRNVSRFPSCVDMEMQFCLASRDPNGNATTGINRVNGSGLANYAANGISMFFNNCNAPAEATVKNLSKWPTGSYYNIWVVNKICQGFNGYVGAASFPNGDAYDGTTIASWVMTEDQYVLAHELGHGFNLYHTFEYSYYPNCPSNTDCSIDGDGVCDTPPHRQNDCDSTNFCGGIGDIKNSTYNFMSYCFINQRFTQGQKNRARATAIAAPRASLLTSLGCAAVITYNFTGTGNYNIASNWQGGLMPPAVLPAGSIININPAVNGQCIMNVPQTVSAGAKFIVFTGKKIVIQGNLRILR